MNIGDILKTLNYSGRAFDSGKIKKNNLWKMACLIIPVQGSKVEVITYDGKQLMGTMPADNNWTVCGYPHDLFNNDILIWRYA